ncbi:hypothetical protein HDU67_004785 [Dinochytrium kinnereticum]|nr:hypothetical protein HDU67_004785 [Dinochytrium kinnereticum]
MPSRKGQPLPAGSGNIQQQGNGIKYADGFISQGGYCDFVRVRSQFAVVSRLFPPKYPFRHFLNGQSSNLPKKKIPDSLPSEVAAPLLCAGVTVFSPLKRFGAGPGKRVGVAGIGGLGHLAIQFASKMGAETVAISTSARKESDSKKLGATGFHVMGSKDSKGRNIRLKPLDMIVVTAVDRDTGLLDPLFRLLRPDGVLIMVDVPERPLIMSPGSLVIGQRGVFGSSIGPLMDLQECLDFAAKHEVYPWVDVMPLSAVNEAIARVRAGDTRFRIVLKVGEQSKL